MNDEVKLILTKLRIVRDSEENGCYICDREHSKLLLSYIEQLQQENQQLMKQKDDVVEYIKTTTYADITGLEKHNITEFWFIKDLLRMLGEIDE